MLIVGDYPGGCGESDSHVSNFCPIRIVVDCTGLVNRRRNSALVRIQYGALGLLSTVVVQRLRNPQMRVRFSQEALYSVVVVPV